MTNIRLSKALCKVVGGVMRGSHATLELLFLTSGAPGPPPTLSHNDKWKHWLFISGMDPAVDSLAVLGNVLEEFMDIGPPEDTEEFYVWEVERERVVNALEENGFRYYRGGRVLPIGQAPDVVYPAAAPAARTDPPKPTDIDELLLVVLKNLRRAMQPLTHRRKGAVPRSFSTEYDVQDLLHAVLRPWVADVRPEEFTPSYAGSSTRMDFLLPAHRRVLELKFVRDSSHAAKIGNELIIDIAHYRQHPGCETLWCIVYDPNHLITNAEGLKKDLEGPNTTKDGTVNVRLLVLQSA